MFRSPLYRLSNSESLIKSSLAVQLTRGSTNTVAFEVALLYRSRPLSSLLLSIPVFDTTAHKRFLLCIFIDADGDMSHLQLLCQSGLFFAFHLFQKFSEGSHMPVGQGKGQVPPLPVLLQKDARAGVKRHVLFGTPP